MIVASLLDLVWAFVLSTALLVSFFWFSMRC